MSMDDAGDDPDRLDHAAAVMLEALMRFERTFADLAIDGIHRGCGDPIRLSDRDAREMADAADDRDPEGRAFAFLLRNIPHERAMRHFRHAFRRYADGESGQTRVGDPPSKVEDMPSGTPGARHRHMPQTTAPSPNMDPIARRAQRSDDELLDLISPRARLARITPREWCRLAVLAVDQAGATAQTTSRLAAELSDLDLICCDGVGRHRVWCDHYQT